MANLVSSELINWETSFRLNADRQVRKLYRVTMDDKSNPEEVIAACTAPTATPQQVESKLDPMGGSAYVLSQDVNPSKDDGSNWVRWDVVVNAGRLPDGQTPGALAQDPFDRPAIIWMERLTQTVPVEEDVNGEPLTNSAGEEFEDPLLEDEDLTVFVIQKNYRQYGDIWQLNETYNKTRNNDVISIPAGISGFINVPVDTLRYLATTTSEPVNWNDGTGDVPYYVGQTRVIFNKNTWETKLLDQGYKELINGDLIEIKDDDVAVSAPRKLDGNGRVLAPAALPNPGANGVYRNYWIYDPVPFAPLFADP